MTHNKLKLNLKNDKQITVLNKTRTTSYQYIKQMTYSSWNFKDSNRFDHVMYPWNEHENARKLKKNNEGEIPSLDIMFIRQIQTS